MTSPATQQLLVLVVVCVAATVAGPLNDHTQREDKGIVYSQNIGSRNSREILGNVQAEEIKVEKRTLLLNEGKTRHLPEVLLTTDRQRERRETLVTGEDEESLSKKPHLLVEEDSRYCTYKRSSITCDFKWTKQTVYVPDKPAVNGQLKKISIYNVTNLMISQSLCVDLILEHVMQARVVKPQDATDTIHSSSSSCSCCTTIIVQHVTSLDRLPDGVGNLMTSSSNITEVAMDRVEAIMTMSKTTVARLSVSETIDKHVEVTLYDVHVHNLEKLHLANDAFLSADKCVFDTVSEGALVLASVGNSMTNVTFLKSSQHAPQNVLLEKGADLTLTDTLGSLRVRDKKCPPPPPPPSCPRVVPKDPQELLQTSPDQAHDDSVTKEPVKCPAVVEPDPEDSGNIAVILLILLIISFCLNAVQLLFNQPRRLIDKLIIRNHPSGQQYFNSVESSVDLQEKASEIPIIVLPLSKDSHKTSSATVSSGGSEEQVVYEKKKQKGKTVTLKTNAKPSAAFHKKTATVGSSNTHRINKTRSGLSKTEDKEGKRTLASGKTNKPVQFDNNGVSSTTVKEIDPLLGTEEDKTNNQPVAKGRTAQTRGLI